MARTRLLKHLAADQGFELRVTPEGARFLRKPLVAKTELSIVDDQRSCGSATLEASVNTWSRQITQVSGTYGHGEAQTIVENCDNTLILRASPTYAH
jgi:hypothetical protein